SAADCRNCRVRHSESAKRRAWQGAGASSYRVVCGCFGNAARVVDRPIRPQKWDQTPSQESDDCLDGGRGLITGQAQGGGAQVAFKDFERCGGILCPEDHRAEIVSSVTYVLCQR